MTDIKTTIDPEDIEWEMDWSGLKPDGSRMFPDKPDKELILEPTGVLTILLLNEVIHTNSHHWKKDWPEDAQKAIYFGVNCNDVFAWGCADSEELQYHEIKPLYKLWKKDPYWGPAIWCMTKRKEMPQRPVGLSIRSARIWDLDALKVEHGLRSNHYDGVSLVIARRKYDAYCAWEQANGREPRPFDTQWWDGWKEYTAANPDWYNEAWKAADEAACAQWRLENGFS